MPVNCVYYEQIDSFICIKMAKWQLKNAERLNCSIEINLNALRHFNVTLYNQVFHKWRKINYKCM